MRLPHDGGLALALTAAIQAGDVDSLGGLLAEHPGLASAHLEGPQGGARTPLHVATDWPGYFPNGPAVVGLLVEAGADPDARTEGHGPETPLHWAASTDDVDVARVLIDAGADIEAQGGSIAAGGPLDNAVGYGCWEVARLLVGRGAPVEKLWHAAGLGLTSRVEQLLASGSPPSPQDLTDAFYQACAGGHRRAAQLLLARGAELNGTVSWGRGTPLDAATGVPTRRDLLVKWLRELGARPTSH
jgi:uncharacterized protein